MTAADQTPAILAEGIVKSYKGDAVLRDLSFSVPRGSICGFLGVNGAGKTTTLRILMGFARPDAGKAMLLGQAAGSSPDINLHVGFVPEVKEPYPFASVAEVTKLTRGFYPNWDHALEKRLIDEWALPLKQRCSKLSKGTAAKLSLLLAICRRPDLLILDEPTDGLDPIAQEQALRLIVEQVTARGMTVFFSTHHLNEVEQVADRVVLLSRGRCTLQGPLDEIKESNRRVRCVVERETAALPTALSHWRRDGRVLTGFSTEDPEVLATALSHAGLKLLEAEPATLKEVFFDQVGAAR
jgi:ABC-2 type transport system ATP-binding protein